MKMNRSPRLWKSHSKPIQLPLPTSWSLVNVKVTSRGLSCLLTLVHALISRKSHVQTVGRSQSQRIRLGCLRMIRTWTKPYRRAFSTAYETMPRTNTSRYPLTTTVELVTGEKSALGVKIRSSAYSLGHWQSGQKLLTGCTHVCYSSASSTSLKFEFAWPNGGHPLNQIPKPTFNLARVQIVRTALVLGPSFR
jgi:hypothetical protein